MKYKLVAIDFDGTFLDDSHFKTNLSYFEKLKDASIEIVFASGRATAGIIELLKRLNILDRTRYIIGHNGAEIYDLKEKKIIFQNKLDENLVSNIINILKRDFKESALAIHDWDKLYVNKFNEMVDLERRVNFVDIVLIDDVKEYPTDKMKLMIFSETKDDNEKLYNILEENFKDNLTQARSLNFLNEITSKGVNKFSALEIILKRLNIKKEEVIAFGNGENDMQMILNVGLGFAMKNSDESLLKLAKNITKYTNNECGVERELLNILYKNNV